MTDLTRRGRSGRSALPLTFWAALTILACQATSESRTPESHAEPSRTVEITRDDFVLRGTLWSGDGPAPAVLLLHQCDGDRTMYAELGERLHAAGLHVLSFDFRGLGESLSDDFDLRRAGGRENWDRAVAEFPGDVEAAYSFLLGAVPVRGGRIGALGASCGGAQLVTLADSHPEVAALAFLSARLSTAEVTQLGALRDRPALFIAAQGDRRAAEAARSADALSRHDASRLILYDGKDHGFPLFRRDPELVSTIAAWFEDILGASPGTRIP